MVSSEVLFPTSTVQSGSRQFTDGQFVWLAVWLAMSHLNSVRPTGRRLVIDPVRRSPMGRSGSTVPGT